MFLINSVMWFYLGAVPVILCATVCICCAKFLRVPCLRIRRGCKCEKVSRDTKENGASGESRALRDSNCMAKYFFMSRTRYKGPCDRNKAVWFSQDVRPCPRPSKITRLHIALLSSHYRIKNNLSTWTTLQVTCEGACTGVHNPISFVRSHHNN